MICEEEREEGKREEGTGEKRKPMRIKSKGEQGIGERGREGMGNQIIIIKNT